MQRVLQHVYIIPLFISMLFSLKSFRLNWHIAYKRFSILLICVFIAEIAAILWKYVLHNIGPLHFSNSNLWLYNSFLIPQYLLYLFVFYKVFESNFIKNFIVLFSFIFTAFAVLNNIFFQSIYVVDSYTLIFASAIIIFLAFSYFEELRGKIEVTKLSTIPMVWIALGALIFHLANLPYLISLEYLIKHNLTLAITLYYIYLGLNCIMYTLYSIAYLCPNPQHK
jgi:hypothetical protein